MLVIDVLLILVLVLAVAAGVVAVLCVCNRLFNHTPYGGDEGRAVSGL
jgi:hypothetical protein